MNKLFIPIIVSVLLSLSVSPVFAETEVSANIPNASFEKWTDTPQGFLPTKWQLELGTANNVARTSRALDGAYAVQLSGQVTLSSEPFYYTHASMKLSANSLTTKGGKGVVKVFTKANGTHPVCKMAIPEFQTKTCVLPFPQSSQYYISISSINTFPLLVDNITLVSNQTISNVSPHQE